MHRHDPPNRHPRLTFNRVSVIKTVLTFTELICAPAVNVEPSIVGLRAHNLPLILFHCSILVIASAHLTDLSAVYLRQGGPTDMWPRFIFSFIFRRIEILTECEA